MQSSATDWLQAVHTGTHHKAPLSLGDPFPSRCTTHRRSTAHHQHSISITAGPNRSTRPAEVGRPPLMFRRQAQREQTHTPTRRPHLHTKGELLGATLPTSLCALQFYSRRAGPSMHPVGVQEILAKFSSKLPMCL